MSLVLTFLSLLVNNIQKLKEIINAEAREIIRENEDLGLGLDILPDSHLAILQLFLDILSLQVIHKGGSSHLSFGIAVIVVAVAFAVPQYDLTV